MTPPAQGPRGFGYLTHVAAPHDRDTAEVYRDTIRLAVAAEELGFATFWVAQHHFGTQRSRLPAPLLLLAAIAEHTSTIRLGTAAITAPLEHPSRLAEDAAVADIRSGGRVELGLGAGSDPATSAHFGADHEQRHSASHRAVSAVLDALRGTDLVPRAPGLAHRVWLASSSPTGAAFAAQHGVGLISGRKSPRPGEVAAADALAAEEIDTYRGSARDAARVAVSRPVLPGIDPAELPERQRDRVYCGPSGTIIDQLRHDPGVALADELICHSQPLSLPVEQELAMLRRLSAEVSPGVIATPN